MKDNYYVVTIGAEIEDYQLIEMRVRVYRDRHDTAYVMIESIIDGIIEMSKEYESASRYMFGDVIKYGITATYTDLYGTLRKFSVGMRYENGEYVRVDGKKYTREKCNGCNPIAKYDEYLSGWLD